MWEKKYTSGHTQFSTHSEEVKDDELPNIYHALIHSPALNTLLQCEHTLSVASADLFVARDDAISTMERRYWNDNG